MAEVLAGGRHHGCLDGGSAAGAGNACGAVCGEAHEAGADAVGEGLDEVGEAVADVDVVDDALAEGGDGVAKEVEGDGNVFFGGAEGEGFKQDDGDADDAEEGSDGGVAEVAAGVESFDYNFEDVARRVDDLIDVVSVIGVPLHQSAEGDCVVVLRITHAVRRAHTIRMSVGRTRCALGAAFNNSLESK